MRVTLKSNSGKRGNTVEMVGKTGGLPYLPQTGLAFTWVPLLAQAWI
jgi:hypothetical protein